MSWDIEGADPIADLEAMDEYMRSQTGIEKHKPWEEMTETERKLAWAEITHGYVQSLYLIGYTPDQVIAELKELKRLMSEGL